MPKHKWSPAITIDSIFSGEYTIHAIRNCTA